MTRSQKYEISVTQSIKNYLKNRADFYAYLLPRIPVPAHRQALEMAVGVFEIPPELDAALETISTDPSADGFTILLGLRDLLKKPAAGRALGRTVISFEETLQASEFVEETGLILFNHLAQSYPPFSSLFAAEAVRRQSALASLLRLQDDLRYHRFPPILS